MAGNKKDSKTIVSDGTKKNEEENAELVRLYRNYFSFSI
jgi:hypothetical protein